MIRFMPISNSDQKNLFKEENMAQGPIAFLSTSPSASHGVTVKPSPTRNGIAYDSVISNLVSFHQGSSSENSRGETSCTTKSIGVSDPTLQIYEVGEQSNDDNEEYSVDNNITAAAASEPHVITEIETIPNNVVVIQDEVLLIEATIIQEPISGSTLKIEISKSIVYGGLTELIASLGIVTSAATTNATTGKFFLIIPFLSILSSLYTCFHNAGKILAVSLASLITGFFVMAYKISELWIKNHESGTDEAEDQENSERYENVFGDRKNYRLHFGVALLSFVLFGLMPPLVYCFTFCKPEDKILKVPTVTIVVVLCIALLGVAKAYIERKTNCVEFVNIIGNCVVDALGTSVLTTIGGELIENYIDKAGWFDPNKIPTLFQPGFSFENGTSAWGGF
ncbi:membrane protein of ER body-like protein isoform X2 [Benincasa hispida]|uniref:membrane protein of ER body-like protein isoform X2 n=1 Tax=Benincasa hispida TaxID=102211 RepID=UPI0018FF79EE|nr:membrane protein of ER body-like protein isoform X2 [Benincasa hispida]